MISPSTTARLRGWSPPWYRAIKYSAAAWCGCACRESCSAARRGPTARRNGNTSIQEPCRSAANAPRPVVPHVGAGQSRLLESGSRSSSGRSGRMRSPPGGDRSGIPPGRAVPRGPVNRPVRSSREVPDPQSARLSRYQSALCFFITTTVIYAVCGQIYSAEESHHARGCVALTTGCPARVLRLSHRTPTSWCLGHHGNPTGCAAEPCSSPRFPCIRWIGYDRPSYGARLPTRLDRRVSAADCPSGSTSWASTLRPSSALCGGHVP